MAVSFEGVRVDDSYRPSDLHIDIPGSPTIFSRGGTRVVAVGSKNGSFFLLDAHTMNELARRQPLPYRHNDPNQPIPYGGSAGRRRAGESFWRLWLRRSSFQHGRRWRTPAPADSDPVSQSGNVLCNSRRPSGRLPTDGLPTSRVQDEACVIGVLGHRRYTVTCPPRRRINLGGVGTRSASQACLG